jgi:hypothetical protein
MPRRPPVEELHAQRDCANLTPAQHAAHRKRALRIGELAMAAGLAHVPDEVLAEAFLVLATRLGTQGRDTVDY